MTINYTDAINLISKAIFKLYENDRYLINKKVHERTLTNRLSIYIHGLMAMDPVYVNYVVDCEYNKALDDPKSLDGKRVIPDIIIHRRGNMDLNAIVIEVKPYWSRAKQRELDKEKIQKYFGLGYEHCLYVEILRGSFSISGTNYNIDAPDSLT